MSTQLDVRPLVATDDLELLDDVLRLAAAAGVEPVVATTATTLRSRWARHCLVVVGSDIAEQLMEGYVPRRRGVVVVGRAEASPDREWELATRLGAEQVASLPAAETWLVDRLSEIGSEARTAGPAVGVIGACGGAGASSLVSAVAADAVSRDRDVTIVDLDSLGAGQELLGGHENPSGLTWNDLANTRGRLRGDTVRASLPEVGGTRVLGWGMARVQPLATGAVGAALDAIGRASDIVVIDLPRQLDDGAAEALCRCDLVVLVVPKTSAAVASAGRVLASQYLQGQRIEAVVRGPSPGGLLAAEIAEALNLPLLCDVPADPGIARRVERGLPPRRARGGLHQASSAILNRLGMERAVSSGSEARGGNR